MATDVMAVLRAIDHSQERVAMACLPHSDSQNALSIRRSTVAAYRDGPAGTTDTPESVRNVISSPGRSLDSSIQRAMEERMGDQLGDVRIHTGPQAAKACEDINARAFTAGNHVAFNVSDYSPSSIKQKKCPRLRTQKLPDRRPMTVNAVVELDTVATEAPVRTRRPRHRCVPVRN